MNQEKLKAVQAAIVKAVPAISALPPYPYNPDAAKAIVEFEKLTSKKLWNEVLEETASLYIENYRQQQAADYRAMLEQQYHGRPIRLADVLLAMQVHDLPDGYLFFSANWRGNLQLSGLAGQKFAPWNLRNDDLTAQSPECIDFLYELLAV